MWLKLVFIRIVDQLYQFIMTSSLIEYHGLYYRRFQVDKEHRMLLEGIQENKVLLNDIKLDLVERINVLELAQQKLRYYIYGVVLLVMVVLYRPEIVPVLAKI